MPVLLQSQTYPTVPINTNVGNLHCGLRLFTAQRVQTWCYEGTGTNQTLPHNTISTISNGRIIVDGYSSGMDQILWTISQIGPMETTIRYSVTTSSLTHPTTLVNGTLAWTVDVSNRVVIRASIWKLYYILPNQFPWNGFEGTIDYLPVQ